MGLDRAIYTYNETTAAAAGVTIQGYIDDFYASIDVNYTPDSMKMSIDLIFTVANAGADQQSFRMICNWFEDAAVINTRLKNVVIGFIASLSNMEGSSSYTIVVSVVGSVALIVNYT